MDEVVRIAARAYELDRYLAALLAPRKVRSDLVAVYAFAGDVGRIASTVSEPMMGEIRLQWWRDAIENGQENTGHPIADAVVGAMVRHRLPAALLLGVIDAEAGPVNNQGMADEQALSSYLAKRDGALFALAWRVRAGGGGSEPAVLAQAGQVYGMTRVLVEVGARAAEGRTLLAADRLAEAGIAPDDIVAGVKAGEALLKLLCEIRQEVRNMLAPIRATWRGYSSELKDVLLPLALVGPYLSAQERLGADCLRRGCDISPLQRVGRLWLARRAVGV